MLHCDLLVICCVSCFACSSYGLCRGWWVAKHKVDAIKYLKFFYLVICQLQLMANTSQKKGQALVQHPWMSCIGVSGQCQQFSNSITESAPCPLYVARSAIGSGSCVIQLIKSTFVHGVPVHAGAASCCQKTFAAAALAAGTDGSQLRNSRPHIHRHAVGSRPQCS